MNAHISAIAKLLAFLLAGSIAAIAQEQVEVTSKTIEFQNGLNGYSGALELGIEKDKGKLGTTHNNIWIERSFKNGNLESEKQALVRFSDIFGNDVSRIPPGASITKATLRLNVGGLEKATSFHRIFLNRMLVDWDENAAWKYRTWGKDGIQADGKEAEAESDGHFVPNRNNTAYDIDVTESLRAWARGEPNHGWVLRNVRTQLSPAAFISSRVNGERRPMLIVSYDSNPANRAPQTEKLSASPSGNSASLSLDASDADKDALTATFYGRKRAKAGPDFEVVLLPDTQYYTMKKHGGTPEMLYSQIDWIIRHHKERNIAFVLQLGDLTDTGDVYKDQEWGIISKALYRLEDPKSTGLPEGIPYVVAVGNHDIRRTMPDGSIRQNGEALYYNKYFGVEHFKGLSYYGGNFGKNNNNYYALLNAGDEKFIVISLEFNFPKRSPGVIKWADELLGKHQDRHCIVITHATLAPGNPGNFLRDGGAQAYEGLKHHKNLRLIIGGHITGEGRRTDEHAGAVVHSMVQDFQFDGNGGNGWLGILTFSPARNRILVDTYSPVLNEWRNDSAGKYSLDYDFGTKIEDFQKLATVKPAANGSFTYNWEELATDADYEWYVEVSDGQKTTRSPVSSLTLK